MRKTDRVYGGVVKEIRAVARTGKEFCVCDFEDPIKARRLLGKMVENGELRRVREGRAGKEMTVYQKA
jgi:hypothetical protein